ncbi:hypothetical protein [Neolewinella agarilytica]|uniref:Lipoprotein n=1 Tax=Neolewinella agarilytica TaxID=478744 RepID=A0A1H9ANI1_9BACT|nr:hypothetical protein [Neolewinella agarilytica]SEP77488.1 hypothetical protein SAMN05444359_102142 [Neolewinella agarilytica]
MLRKISLFVILLVCLIQACAPDEIDPVVAEAPSLVGRITETGPALTVPNAEVTSIFLNNFPVSDISLIELVENKTESGKYFLYAEGNDLSPDVEDGQKLAMRFTTESRGNEIHLFLAKSLGESCSGVNCSLCAFKDGGGCTCKKAIDLLKPAGCNHTITKPDEE